MRRKILVTAGRRWRSPGRFGIHFLTDFFIKKEFDVFWLTVPFSLMSLIKPTFLKEKYEKLRTILNKGYIYKEHNSRIVNVMVLSIFHPIKFLPFLDGEYVAKNYLRFSLPSLKYLIKTYDFGRPDILMSSAGGISGDISQFVNPKFTIYRLNDLMEGFPNMPKGRIALNKKFLRRADLILPVSRNLYNYAVQIRKSEKGIYLIPNGVDINKFLKKREEPLEYKKIPRPRAIYAGALRGWFDWDLIRSIAKINKKISFVIIGRGNVPLGLPENIFVLGPKPHKRIPAFMQNADVGLIPFKNMSRMETVERPLKFYEYLSSGIPIVSVSYGGLKEGMSPYAIFANTPEDFLKSIKKALSYSKEEKEKLKRVAKQFSWNEIYKKLTKILEEYGIKF